MRSERFTPSTPSARSDPGCCGSAGSASIALDPSGRDLFVADARAGKLAVLDTGALDRNALVEREPRVTVVALPRAVRRNGTIALTTTKTGVTLDASDVHAMFDVAAMNWRQQSAYSPPS